MNSTVLSVLIGSAIAAGCMLVWAMIGRMEVDQRHNGPDNGTWTAENPATYQATQKKGYEEQLRSVSTIWKLGLPIGGVLGGVIGLMWNLSSGNPAVGTALVGGLVFAGIGICLAAVIAVRYGRNNGQMTPSLALFMFFLVVVLPAFICGVIGNGLLNIVSIGGDTPVMPPSW
jgi:hypothetical protein